MEYVSRSAHPLEGVLTGHLRGTGRIESGVFKLTAATADLSAPRIAMEHREIRDVKLTAETSGTELKAHVTAGLLESMIQANGVWRLEGDSPGSATVTFSKLSVASLHQLVMAGKPISDHPEEPPFEGSLEGGATISVALQKPEAFHAVVTLDPVQVNPRPNQRSSWQFNRRMSCSRTASL